MVQFNISHPMEWDGLKMKLVKKSGIQKQISSHILRHTYATHLLEMGTDIMTLKDLLGHIDIKTTMLYLHICNLDKHKAFSPMDRIYKIK